MALNYGGLYGRPAARAAAQGVAPLEQASVLREIGAAAGGTLSRVGSALSAPDDYIRGALVGRPGERVDGWELLKSLGVIGDDPGWGGWGLGLATDILTSPSTYLLGPSQSLTKAGVAAKSLNLLDSAPVAATKKAIDSGLDAATLPRVAQNNLDYLQRSGRNVIDKMDPAVTGRPLYGTRTARRATTLDDLIRYADDPDAAEKAARDLLGGSLDEVRGETLSKSFGIGAPFGNPLAVGDPFGAKFGDQYADALDTVGQAFRWSGPGRWAASAFDNRVGGKVDAEEQIFEAAKFDRQKTMRSRAVRDHTLQQSRMRMESPEVFSEEGNRILGRVLEGQGTPEDLAYVSSRPAVQAYVDWWDSTRDTFNRQSMSRGLPEGMTADPYGTRYLPRAAHPALGMDRFAGDQLSRTSATQVPGGRDTIMDLSQDSFVTGKARKARNDDEAAQYIMQRLNAMVGPDQPPIEIDQARNLAKILSRLPNEVTAKSPLFGQHPVEMIGDYVGRRASKLGAMDTLYDSLATMAAGAPAEQIGDGRRYISLADALEKKLPVQTHVRDTLSDAFEVLPDGTTRDIRPEFGARQQMRKRLAELTGLPEDEIELSQFSVPEDHVDRLVKGSQALTNDEAAQGLVNILDHYTVAWRGSILTWPARAVRDLYSGAVQNWMAGASDGGAVIAASRLMRNGPTKEFTDYLSTIPRYTGNDGINQFYADLAASGLMQTGTVSDIAGASVGQRALDALPGANPINLGTMVGEFAPQQGRTWTDFGRDLTTWRSKLRPNNETMNPLLRAGEQMNSLTDGINRISGFLALVKKGMDPQAAAKQIQRVQVDYSTLTAFERNWLKSIFPWYSFQSRIFRTVLNELVERPGGRYGHLVRGTEALQSEGNKEDVYVPSALRSQFAFPIPEFLGGKPSAQTQKYFTDLDFPGFDQINMIETPGTLAGTMAGTARQIAMQTHPAIRLGIEYATGQDLFSRRPLKEAPTATESIVRGVTGDPAFRLPSFVAAPVRVAENMPFVGRPLSLARQLADTRGDRPLSSRAINSAVNALSGVKLRDVAQEDVLADAVRQINESIDPYTREFSQVYVPENEMLNVPAYALRRLEVSRELARQRRALREQAIAATSVAD